TLAGNDVWLGELVSSCLAGGPPAWAPLLPLTSQLWPGDLAGFGFFGPGERQLGAQYGHDEDGRGEHERGADRERQVIAARQRGCCRSTARQQAVRPLLARSRCPHPSRAAARRRVRSRCRSAG